MNEAISQDSSTASTRRWCWYAGNTDAVPQISILALVETLIAVLVYVWIAIEYGTLHITISACIAPFLLLRTPESTALGPKIGLPLVSGHIKFFNVIFNNTVGPFLVMLDNSDNTKLKKITIPPIASVLYLICTLIFMIPTALIIFAVRIAATFICTCAHPLGTLRAIPANWWRVAARVDSSVSPEPLPGIQWHTDDHNVIVKAICSPYIACSGFTELFFDEDEKLWSRILFVGPLVLSYIIFIVLPALLYRYSLKGTSLFYSPLIWVVHGAVKGSLRDRVAEVRTLAVYRMSRLYSIFVLAFFVSKILFFSFWNNAAFWWNETYAADFLNAFVAPQGLPRWQIAAAANAILAWLLFFIADYVLLQYDRGNEPNQALFDFSVGAIKVGRGVLTFYTITATIYLAASLVEKWGLPPIGDNWLPSWY